MAGMEDLDFEGLVNGAFEESDDDDTAKMDATKLFGPKGRKNLKTPVLSGRKMASESSAAIALTDPDTVEQPVDPERLEQTRSEFGSVYQKAGLEGKSFDIFKLEELYEDEEIRDLAPAARKAAVRAILKSHGVELQTMIDDAVERRDALEKHDARMKRGVKNIVARVDKDNEAIQKEIEQFANPRIEKMEANERHAEQTRRKYRDWLERKQGELSRIVGIVEVWGGDDRLRVTEKVSAVQDNKTTVPNEAISAEPLSGDDVFDRAGAETAKIVTMDEVGASAAKESKTLEESSSSERTSLGEEWSFSDVEEMKPSSVETELPSTFQVAGSEAEDDSGPSPDVTESFSFDNDRPVWMPRTAVEGIVAALAVLIWAPAGLLLTAQLNDELETIWSVAVGWGAPIVLAVLVTVGFGLAHKQVRFFSFALFFSVLALVGAHYDPPSLHTQLMTRPLPFVEELGLASSAEESIARVTVPYGTLLEDQLGLKPIDSTAGDGE